MEDSFLFWKRGHSTPVLMNRDMEEGGCVNTPGQAGRNELRPYKILVGAEGSMVEAMAQRIPVARPLRPMYALRAERSREHVSGRAQTEVCATKNKNGRLAEAHRPFHIFVKWN
jgi:hypothetical protein